MIIGPLFFNSSPHQAPTIFTLIRIGPKSTCLCGHTWDQHKGIGKHTVRPPACTCSRCPAFRYAPTRPEEVGQWHLPRRKDFNLKAWQERVRARPHDYACVGCDHKIADHVVLIESEQERARAGLTVGKAYMPLSDSPVLQQIVLGGGAAVGRYERKRGTAP